MKKTLAMLMTATMVLSMGVGASAAENGYSILLQNNKLTLSGSENTVTYQLEEDEILLGQSAAGGIWTKMQMSTPCFLTVMQELWWRVSLPKHI